jgi:hypothetical protein
VSLPFDRAQFFAVLRDYNETFWPFQVLLVLAGFAAVALAAAGGRGPGRAISAILAALWAWMGVVYHGIFFLPVNPAAALFGAFFLAAAALFAWEGVVHGRLRFECAAQARCVAAFALIACALVVYPLAPLMLGRDVLELASFGLPCPTTVFTLGMLGLLKPPFSRAVFVVPVLWALVGMQAAWLLGVYEDLALAAAALAGLWFVFAQGTAQGTRSKPA